MGTQAVKKGDIAEAVAKNVTALRGKRRLSQQALAALMGELGRPMQSSAIAKIEKGDRRVDVDDLVALAVALNVAPARLLLPDLDVDEPVQVTPTRAVPSYAAWQWATGQHSLLSAEHDLNDPGIQKQELEFAAERPVWLLSVEQHSLHRAVKHLEWSVRRAIGSRAGVISAGADRPSSGIGLASWVSSVRKALTAVEGQVDQLAEEAADVQR